MPGPMKEDGIPRLSPFDELELMDLKVRAAAVDEEKTMFDDKEHPKPPQKKEEAVTDMMGEEQVDLMADTPPIDKEVEFDLSEDELGEIDL